MAASARQVEIFGIRSDQTITPGGVFEYRSKQKKDHVPSETPLTRSAKIPAAAVQPCRVSSRT